MFLELPEASSAIVAKSCFRRLQNDTLDVQYGLMEQNLPCAISSASNRRSRLDLHDPDTVRVLCERFHCDVIALWDAAARVGLTLPALDRELTAH